MPAFHNLRRPLVASLALAFVTFSGCKTDPPTTGGGGNDYNFEIRYVGTAPTGATLTSMQAAYAKVNQMVTAKLTAVGIPAGINLEDDCGLTGADVDVPTGTHEGLIVYIQIVAIDGAGGTLGSAGPCLIRPPSGNSLPVLGTMKLDAADVASLQSAGRLTTVVLHEMFHILGFGTMWEELGLRDTTTLNDARFLGTAARTACATTNGGATPCATNVPVHSADGAGSIYSHWRESLFTNELMTPFLTAGATPFSATTIQSFADLGYTVTTVGADAFTISGTLLRMAPAPDDAPVLQYSEPSLPRWSVSEDGRLIPLRNR